MQTARKYADGTLQAASLIFGLLILFLPLFLIYFYQVDRSAGSQSPSAEVAVGVAVMLRTTFRRLLRAGTSNLLRTSLGAFSRTSARTMTRTLTRRVARISARVLLRILTVRPNSAATAIPEWHPGALSGVAVGLGFVALALSFAFVATREPAAVQEELLSAGSHARYTIRELSIFAALPVLVYAAVGYLVARRLGSRVRVNTALDGLLLQAYFAGAGSFLPMTTDLEYEADDRTQFRISACVLLILYVLHLVLQFVATMFEVGTAATLSAFLLLYCFVFSFPIRPLEGFAVWRGSKRVWLLLCVPILISFLTWLPAEIMDLL